METSSVIKFPQQHIGRVGSDNYSVDKKLSRSDDGNWGGGNDGGGSMEARIAKLESDVSHIQTDVSEIKADIRHLLIGGICAVVLLFGSTVTVYFAFDNKLDSTNKNISSIDSSLSSKIVASESVIKESIYKLSIQIKDEQINNSKNDKP